MNLTLGDIAAACKGKLVLRGKEAVLDRRVSSVDVDSRKVAAGGVFIATLGERVDGHKFIVPVFARGGILAVTQKTPEEVEAEHGCKAEEWGSYLLVEDTLRALREIGEAYRRKLHTKIVGLTGSSGKTTTKEFIAGVLGERYRVMKTEGNYNNEIGVPLTLLGIRDEHEVAVVEMGISDFGEMHRLSKMARPDVCVITNIGQSHLKDLKSRDGILKAKSEIFDFMAEDGEICLNGEDDKLITLKEVKGHKPHFFGLGTNPEEEVAAEEIVCHGLEGSDVVLRMDVAQTMDVGRAREAAGQTVDAGKACEAAMDAGRVCGAAGQTVDEGKACEAAMDAGRACEAAGQAVQADRTCEAAGQTTCAGRACEDVEHIRVAVHVPQPGRHMVLNAAAAACVARLFGLTGEEIRSGIAKVASVGGRANLIKVNGYTLIDDCYNANPESMRAAIDLLALADTKKVAILGDMFNLGEDYDKLHGQMGIHAVDAGIENIICVGEASKFMYEAAVKRAEETGKNRVPDSQWGEASVSITYFPDRQALLERLSDSNLIPEGSTILVKASHGMEFAEVLESLRLRLA